MDGLKVGRLKSTHVTTNRAIRAIYASKSSSLEAKMYKKLFEFHIYGVVHSVRRYIRNNFFALKLI
jgi:hypothetical protein